jgi:hypothetical protein
VLCIREVLEKCISYTTLGSSSLQPWRVQIDRQSLWNATRLFYCEAYSLGECRSWLAKPSALFKTHNVLVQFRSGGDGGQALCTATRLYILYWRCISIVPNYITPAHTTQHSNPTPFYSTLHITTLYLNTPQCWILVPVSLAPASCPSPPNSSVTGLFCNF